MADQARLSAALLLSFLLHAALLAALPRTARPGFERLLATPVEVELLPLPSAPISARPAPVPATQPPPVLLPERQIVEPPDAGEEKPPPATRLLSDRDHTVAQEQVRRGEGAAAARAPAATAKRRAPAPSLEQAARATRPVPAPEQLAALPPIERLLPKAGDVGWQSSEKPAAEASRGRDFLAAGNLGTLSYRSGTRDFLPGVREGDITLLNTKAERFAPFVRRVAKRVFDHIEIELKHAVRAGRVIQPGHEGAEVEAVMDRAGRFLEARLVRRQGSSGLAVDRILLRAARPDTFFDANPPPGVESEDGNIHFVLTIDLRVDAGMDPRTGLASAGYSGVAGVGLR